MALLICLNAVALIAIVYLQSTQSAATLNPPIRNIQAEINES